ncbi:MAG: hypothetical protein ACJ739_04345, partial [Acidimicrobiales bacterium]
LTWLTATVLAVLVALQAVGAIGDQVTDTPAAAARATSGSSSTTTSTTPPSSTSTTTPVAPAGETAAPVGAVPSAPDPTVQTAAPEPEAEGAAPEVEPEPEAHQPEETEPAKEPGATTSYSLQGGSIGVRCTGSVIELVYSSPAQGFGSEVNSAGPDEVDVRFESDTHRSRIKVQCGPGKPVVVDQREEPR